MRQFVLLLSTLVAAVHGSYPHYPSVPASGYSVPYTCCGPPAAPVVAPASVVASAPVVAPTAIMAAAPVVSPAAVVAEAPVVAPAPMIAPAPVLAPAAVMPAPVMASAPVYTSMVPYAMPSHHYHHPRTAIRNIVSAYSKETGHYSDTSMVYGGGHFGHHFPSSMGFFPGGRFFDDFPFPWRGHFKKAFKWQSY
ncbi:hypothetical protein Aduo_017221 [Ancylostoma duodenale]